MDLPNPVTNVDETAETVHQILGGENASTDDDTVIEFPILEAPPIQPLDRIAHILPHQLNDQEFLDWQKLLPKPDGKHKNSISLYVRLDQRLLYMLWRLRGVAAIKQGGRYSMGVGVNIVRALIEKEYLQEIEGVR